MPDNLVMARVARQDIQNRINHIKNNIKFKISILNTIAVKLKFSSFYNCLHVGSFLKVQIYKSSPEINVKIKANMTL
jgi:hypothetical protein